MDDGFSFQLPAMIGWRAWSCVVVRGAAVGANAAAGASASASTSLAMVDAPAIDAPAMRRRCEGWGVIVMWFHGAAVCTRNRLRVRQRVETPFEILAAWRLQLDTATHGSLAATIVTSFGLDLAKTH